jgi:hypothetical protein
VLIRVIAIENFVCLLRNCKKDSEKFEKFFFWGKNRRKLFLNVDVTLLILFKSFFILTKCHVRNFYY